MSNYNPFKSVFSLAIAELTSDSARAYYSHRAQSDIQTTLEFVVQLCCAVYELGIAAREWVEVYNEASIPTVGDVLIIEPQPLLPGAATLPALPAVALPHPDRDRAFRRSIKAAWQQSAEWGHSLEGLSVLVTPASPAPKRRRGGRKPKAA